MIDQPQDLLTNLEQPQVIYSTFWQRFLASLLDGLILIPFVIIDSFNKTTWKSIPLLVMTFLLTLAYKPFMEAKYHATLGKMALNLTIVDNQHVKPSLNNILLRNIFDISNRIIIGITAFITFSNAAFEDVNSNASYSVLANALTGATLITVILSLLWFVDAIFLIADSRERRALHDRIGKTLVVQK